MLGLEACTCLEELYLSHNGIWRLEGLASLCSLRVLDVSNNRISAVEVGLGPCPGACLLGQGRGCRRRVGQLGPGEGGGGGWGACLPGQVGCRAGCLRRVRRP
jgi:hypothetical protein